MLRATLSESVVPGQASAYDKGHYHICSSLAGPVRDRWRWKHAPSIRCVPEPAVAGFGDAEPVHAVASRALVRYEPQRDGLRIRVYADLGINTYPELTPPRGYRTARAVKAVEAADLGHDDHSSDWYDAAQYLQGWDNEGGSFVNSRSAF